jgi:DNA-binding NarL/FixJ family response regulator
MTSTKLVRIFLAEDQLIARMGLKMLLEQTKHFDVIGEAEDGQTAVEKILETKPEVVMMDLGLPKLSGIEATAQVKKALPDTKVIIFTTASDDSNIFSALKAGADGYCLKTISGEMLSIAIESVLNGAAWLDPGIANRVLRAQQQAMEQQQQAQGESSAPANLSESKLQLLSLVEKGKSFEEIAIELKVSDSLVKGLLNELLVQLKGDKVQRPDERGLTKKTDAPVYDEETGRILIRAGDIIAQHYKVVSRIGAGGMGSVYKAQHTFIDRTVAIKTLNESLISDDTLARFKVEAESHAAVVHQNLVTGYDFGLIDGKVPYIVMEYLDGITFDDLLQSDGQVDLAQGIDIFMQICDGLQAVHSRGIVHRDLKPGNIMLLKQSNDRYLVKLVDFGIAKIVQGNKPNITQAGECMGSPLYMSPEQCWGSGKMAIDHRSDLYALGCMMYEAFSGYTIFEAYSVMEVLMKHIKEEPSTLPLEDAKLPTKLIELIMLLTKKDPNHRPQTASIVREHLSKI